MRSIGKVKIKKLCKIVYEECNRQGGRYPYDYTKVRENIKARIPSEWYDTWESAWSEIERLVEDFIHSHIYSK